MVGNPETIQKRGSSELIATADHLDDYRSYATGRYLVLCAVIGSSWERLGKEVETTKRAIPGFQKGCRSLLISGGREGIRTPNFLVANRGENKLRQGATI